MAGIVASKMRRQRSKNSGQGGPQVRDHHEEWEKRRKQVTLWSGLESNHFRPSIWGTLRNISYHSLVYNVFGPFFEHFLSLLRLFEGLLEAFYNLMTLEKLT